MPALAEGRLGNHPEPEQQRNCREERDDDITMEAGQKQTNRFAGRSALRLETGKQNDAQYEPASQQREEPKSGKSIARFAPGRFLDRWLSIQREQ